MVLERSQNGFSATFFQNVLQTLRKLSKKARIKFYRNFFTTKLKRCHNVFCNVVPNRCHNVFTTFFVTLYQNVLQTLRKLSKKARINVLPKRFHNQIKTLSQRFHNVFLLAGEVSENCLKITEPGFWPRGVKCRPWLTNNTYKNTYLTQSRSQRYRDSDNGYPEMISTLIIATQSSIT